MTSGSFAAITRPQQGSLGIIAGASIVLVVIAATQARLGFGKLGDVLVALVALTVVAAGYGLFAFAAARLARQLRSRPVAATVGLVLGSAAVLRGVLGVWIVQPIVLLVLGVVGGWGAVAASAMSNRGLPIMERLRWRWIAGAALGTALGYLLIGFSPSPVEEGPGGTSTSIVSTRMLPLGPLAVERARYGSGTDIRRVAYGANVSFRSSPVDVAPYFPLLRGWRARVHSRYWGFSLERAPLNAEVWMPRGEGPFPVVLMMHRVLADEGSELGFGYLAEQLASRGMVAIAVDANYLNGPWVDAADGGIAGRAALLLHHLSFLREQSAAPRGLLAGRLDLTRVALLGHSRGGESAAAAAMWLSMRRNPEFPDQVLDTATVIRAVVALAPTDGLYRPAGQSVTLAGVNYLLIRGTRDADAPLEAGVGQYQRTLLDSSARARKVSIAIVGANHARFNSLGDQQDLPTPLSWLLEPEGLLTGAAQRALTSTAVVAFLTSSTQNGLTPSDSLSAMITALAARTGTSVTIRTSDGATRMLAEFDEDADVTTGSVRDVRLVGRGLTEWHEDRSPRSGNSVVYLAWDQRGQSAEAPSYELALTDQGRVSGASRLGPGVLTFAVANAGARTAFTIELVTASGQVARRVIELEADADYDRSEQRWRSPVLEQSMVGSTSPTLHTMNVALAELVAAAKGVNVRDIRIIRFRFDRTERGRILLDDIGLRAGA